MKSEQSPSEDGTPDKEPHPSDKGTPTQFAAWEEIEAGRFMPRRTRGSDRGRALG